MTTDERTARRPGRPPLGDGPMTPAQRKGAQRARARARAVACEIEAWSDADCLQILASPDLASVYGLDAWRRLGSLRGFA